jgi:hypothetical protein
VAGVIKDGLELGTRAVGEPWVGCLQSTMNGKEGAACLSASPSAFSILWLLEPPWGFFHHSGSSESTHCICSHSHRISQTATVTASLEFLME